MKKPIIRYTLEPKSKDIKKRIKPELIIAEVNAGFVSIVGSKTKYNRFKYSLKANILPKNFGLPEENYRFNKEVFDKYSRTNRGIKSLMEHFEDKIDLLHSNYVKNGENPSANEFKRDLEILIGRKEKDKKIQLTVHEFLNQKIKDDLENMNSAKKDAIKENTIKSYNTLSNYIENYEFVTKRTLTFDDLNEKVYWNFWDIQDDILRGNIEISIEGRGRKQQIKPMGFLVNSIVKYQKSLIKALRDAKETGIQVNLDLDDINLVLEEKPNSKDLYLSENMLNKIISADNVSNELSQARDYVVLASLLGMRYESMEEAANKNVELFKDKNYNFYHIHSKQNKTGTEVIIPIMKPALNIIKKYDFRFPKFASNQEINRWVKQLFKFLKINNKEELIYHTYKLGVIKVSKPISEIISTHDFRKTFYSNLILLNAEERFIDSVTHPDKAKSNKMNKVYDRVKMLDKAKQFYDEINRVNKIKKSQIYSFN